MGMEKPPQRMLLDVSWEALFKVIAVVAGIWALFLLREIFLMLFIVFIFVAAVSPTISAWQKHMSRTLAVVLLFTLFLLALVTFSYIFIPPLVHQVNELSKTLPDFISKMQGRNLGDGNYGALINQASATLRSSIGNIGDNLLSTTVGFFGGVASLVTGLILSFYLLLEEKNAREFFHQILPHHRYRAVYVTVQKISERMGSWIRGQLLLMLVVGVLNFISYSIIGVPTPLPLAIWAGLTEAIPYVGPLLGVFAAGSVALASGSAIKAALVAAVSLLGIQQLEGTVLVPRIMGRAIGLSPVLVVLAIVVGVKLFGLLGAVIAIPSAAVISVVVGEWPSLRKIWQEEQEEDEKEEN
jgi:predicted PurR-regulated permease PerM